MGGETLTANRLNMPSSFTATSTNWPVDLLPGSWARGRRASGVHPDWGRLAVSTRREQTFEVTHVLSQRRRSGSFFLFFLRE